MPRPKPPHGTANCYTNLGCRCEPCCAAQKIKRAAHWQVHKEKEIVVHKQWIANHREQERYLKREGGRRERRHHPERSKERLERHRITSPEMYAATRQKNGNIRRARQLLASVGIPSEIAEWEAILQDDPCCYCGAQMEHVDHVLPLSVGGDHDWTNQTAACAACNMAKKEKPLLDFLLYCCVQEYVNVQPEA